MVSVGMVINFFPENEKKKSQQILKLEGDMKKIWYK